MSDTGQTSQLPPDKPLSPEVVFQQLGSLSQPSPPSNQGGTQTFSVNQDGSGDLILTHLNNDDVEMEFSQNKDFYSDNDFTQSIDLENTESKRTKRSLSASEVDAAGLGPTGSADNAGAPAKLARTEQPNGRPNKVASDIFQNKGKSRILVIKCMDNLNIFSNPNRTLEFLKSSGLEKIKTGPHEVQGRGGCLKIEVSLDSEFDFGKLNKFGDHNLRAWFPASDKNTMGVIYPVDKDVTLDGIFSNLVIIDDKHNASPLELKRIHNKEGPTDLIKITFEGELPNRVSVYGQVYNVRKYNRAPVICFRCIRWGHGLITCSSSMRCGFCGGNHLLDACGKEGSPHCLHCGKDHITGARSCVNYSLASKIETFRSKNLISYDESKYLYRDLNNKRYIALDYKLERFKPNNPPHVGSTQGATKKIPTNTNLPDRPSPINLSNYYEALSDDMDDIDLNESVDSTVRNDLLFSDVTKSKPRKTVRKKITVCPSEIGAVGVTEEGNCLFDDWGIPVNNPNKSTEPKTSNIKQSSLNNARSSVNRPNRATNSHSKCGTDKATNLNKNTNQTFSKDLNANDSSFSFFYSVITKLVDFIRLKHKTSESCALFAWNIFDLITRHFDLSF